MLGGTRFKMELFLLVINLMGTAVFAVSGAVVALRKGMDIFGVCTLGLTTAVGGGVIRDVILGNTPPVTFRDPTYAIVALAVSVLIFLLGKRRLLHENERFFNLLLLWMDSLGLGVFTVTGVDVAYRSVEEPSLFLLAFVGVVTGVGGGVLRDVMAQDTPFILVKHVYASASLAGAFVCVGLYHFCGTLPTTLVGIAVVVLIRVLSAHYRWNLPRVAPQEKTKA